LTLQGILLWALCGGRGGQKLRRLFKGIAVLLVLGLLAGAWRGDIKWREWVVDQDWATDIEWPDWLNMGVDGDYDLDDFDKSVSSTVSAFLQYAETRQEALEVLDAGANGDQISQASAVDRVFDAWDALVEELTLFGLVAESVDELNEYSAHTGREKNLGLPDGLAVSGFTSLASSASDSSTLLLAQVDGGTGNCPPKSITEKVSDFLIGLIPGLGSLGLGGLKEVGATAKIGNVVRESIEAEGEAEKKSGGDELNQGIAKALRVREVLSSSIMPSLVVNASKGQAAGVFGAFAAAALSAGVVVPTLTTLTIAGAGGYVVGKGVEYLFLSDTASVVAGKTGPDGKTLIPKDQCGTLVIDTEKNEPVVANGFETNGEKSLEISGSSDESPGKNQIQISTEVPESVPTCSDIMGLNHRFKDLGNAKISVEVSTTPELTGCPVTFSGRIVNESAPDKSEVVSESFTALGTFEVNGPSIGSFRLAGTLTSGEVSSTIEHRVIQKGPRIVEMQLPNPSKTINLGDLLNLGLTPLRVTYEDETQHRILATALNSEIQWSLSSGPGTLEGNTYIANEAGIAALVVTYVSDASSISETLTVLVEDSQIPEEENQTEVIASEGPLSAEASFRAVGEYEYEDSWYENRAQGVGEVFAGFEVTLNEIEMIYSTESGEVSGEFKTDYFYDITMDFTAEEGPYESCRLSFISSASIDAKASSYNPATGVLQGSTDEYLFDVDVVADSTQSGYCQAWVTQLETITPELGKYKFSGSVENGSIRGQIEPIQNPYGSPPVLFSLTVVDSE
jgi:hypothetical protein